MHSQEAYIMTSPKGNSTIYVQDSQEMSNEEQEIQEIVHHIEQKVGEDKKSGHSQVERNRMEMIRKN